MKHITTATFTFATILLLFNLSVHGQPERVQPRRPALAPGLAARVAANGRVRVIVGLDVPAAARDRAGSFGRVQQQADIESAQSRLLRRLGGLRLGQVKRFRLTPGMAIEVDYPALQYLAAQSDVAYVVEDRMVKPTLMQSAAIVGATAATAAGYTGRGQTIAVLDTGIDRDHPFLGGRVVAEACFSTTSSTTTALCQSGTTGPGAATPCLDGCDHGTHVAGIAVGRGMLSGTTAQGMAPDATIISIQVFSRQNIGGEVSAFFSDVNLALEHVYSLRTAYKIAAVNMSLGTDAVYPNCDAMYPTMKVNIDALRSAGIATVVSSGNSGASNGLSFPACISSTISVGSTMDGSYGAYPVDGVSWFSNSSSGLRLLAPGEFITSSIPTWNGGEAAYSGTSMAAPHVAGAWAVIKSRVQGASVDAVLDALNTTGKPVLDERNGLVRQRINVLAAVKALAGTVTTALPATERARSDFNGDGFGDLLWQDAATGSLALWMLKGDHTSWSAVGLSQRLLDTNWHAVGTGDFNGDGRPDVVWHHATTGALYVWFMAGTERVGHAPFSVAGEADTAWRVAGVGDFNRDDKPDLLWQHEDGRLAVWLMDGTSVVSVSDLSPSRVLDPAWQVAGVGDLNADGQSDVIFEHRGSGELAAWLMNGAERAQYLPFSPGRILDLNWKLAAVLDVDGDHAVDLIWQNPAQHALAVWYMNGTERTGVGTFPWTVGATWLVSGPR